MCVSQLVGQPAGLLKAFPGAHIADMGCPPAGSHEEASQVTGYDWGRVDWDSFRDHLDRRRAKGLETIVSFLFQVCVSHWQNNSW